MKWSWKLGRVGGTELRVHATFVILLAWLALALLRETGTLAGVVGGLLFVLALFCSVVLHELGHVLVARHFGVPTRDITLLPIGGVARMERIPERPREELLVALAGPAVTFVIVATLYLTLRLLGLSTSVSASGSVVRGSVLAQLMWVNVTLLVFNLLPAFPMDGGRVLRALLARRMDYLRATEHAARIGRAFALAFGLLGLMYDPMLVLIALFVWLGAAAESSALQLRSSLAGADVARVMITDLRTLAPTDTLETALQHVLSGFQHDFPVVEGDRVVGVLTRAALRTGLATHGRDARVADSMERSFGSTEPQEPLERAMSRLGASKCQTMPVLSNGHLRGVLTLDNVGEYVAISAALRAATTGHAAS